jgi:hypothetical protein
LRRLDQQSPAGRRRPQAVHALAPVDGGLRPIHASVELNACRADRDSPVRDVDRGTKVLPWRQIAPTINIAQPMPIPAGQVAQLLDDHGRVVQSGHV